MSGSGATNLAATGTLQNSGSGSPNLDTRTFNNAGTVNWGTTGYLYFTNSAVFNNQSGANFNVQTAGAYLIYSNSTGAFNNLSGATFTKSSSGDTGIYSLSSFTNNGTVTLASAGSLFVGPSGISTHTGPFKVNNANATLNFQGGTHYFNTGADFTGSGHVAFSGGSETIHSIYNLSGSTIVSGGTVSFPSDATLTSLGSGLTISSGSIDLSSGEDITLAALTESGGTLTGSDTVNVTSSLAWSGGTMSGFGVTGLAATATLASSGSSSITLDTRTFNNAGIVNWGSTGYLYFTNGAVFNNQSGATFDVQAAGSYLIYGNSTGVFNNLSGATFTKSSTGDTGIYYLASFDNAGTLSLTNAGSLFVSPTGTSTHTGPFNINNANATLNFQGGVHNFNAGANFTGSGHVAFSGGTETIHSTFNLSGSTIVSGGTASFPSDATLTSLGSGLTISSGSIDLSSGEDITLAALTESGGTLTGSDTVNVTSNLTWSGGTMSGFGVTNLTATATLATSGSSSNTLDTRTFNNAGTVNWGSTGYLYFTNSAVFNNQSGATFDVQAAGSYLIYGNSTGVFNNLSGATFTKSSTGDTGIYYLASFNNNGTMSLTSAGSLILSPTGTSTHTGPFNINNANATLNFQGGIHNFNAGANLTGSGQVIFSGGTETFHSTFNPSGPTLVSGGTVSFPSDATITSLGSNLTISAGSLDLSTGKNLTLPAMTESNGTLTGSDTITITTSLNWSAGTMSGAGVTNLAASATMDASGSGSPTLSQRTFNNAGTVNWNTTGYLSMASNATFNNMSGATFNTLSSGYYLIYGYGANLVNSGTLNLPTGKYIQVNTFTQTATGVINMTITGNVAGTDYCQISGTTSNLGGTVNVTLSGYAPVFGDAFNVVLYTTENGTFSHVSLPLLDPGFLWGTLYKSDRFQLTILYGVWIPITEKP